MKYYLIFILLISLSFCFAGEKTTVYIITADRVNLRNKPSVSSEKIDILTKDTPVYLLSKEEKTETIDNKEGVWFQIEKLDGKIGYAFSAYFEKLENEKKSKRDLSYLQLENKYCKDIHNSYECALSIEKNQKIKYGSLFSRKDNKLELFLKNKTSIVLTNNKNEYYIFRDFIDDIGYYLIDKHFQEGGIYLLINSSSGTIIQIWNKSFVISPDKKMLAVTSADLESHYSKNGIQIINLENGIVFYH